MEAAAQFTNCRIVSVVGGMAANKQERLLSSHPHIIVASPGRLWELIQQRSAIASQKIDFSQLRFLALDEADRMMEDGAQFSLSISVFFSFSSSSLLLFFSLSSLFISISVSSCCLLLAAFPHATNLSVPPLLPLLPPLPLQGTIRKWRPS
jgi:hypothetical protein